MGYAKIKRNAIYLFLFRTKDLWFQYLYLQKKKKNRERDTHVLLWWNLSGGSHGKESACNVGGPGSVSWLGRSSGEGNGNTLQCSCLENFMGRGVWWTTVHGTAKSQT